MTKKRNKLKKTKKAVIDHRRVLVARLRLRGQTAREIIQSLARPVEDPVTGEYRPLSINPNTGAAWGLGTIGRDFKELEKAWRKEALAASEERKANLLAQLEELKREGWRQNDLRIVLATLKAERELMGLDAEQAVQHSGDLILKIEGNVKPDEL